MLNTTNFISYMGFGTRPEKRDSAKVFRGSETIRGSGFKGVGGIAPYNVINNFNADMDFFFF